jgi:hypothetical protein
LIGFWIHKGRVEIDENIEQKKEVDERVENNPS